MYPRKGDDFFHILFHGRIAGNVSACKPAFLHLRGNSSNFFSFRAVSTTFAPAYPSPWISRSERTGCAGDKGHLIPD
jgi:hypothetical protein